MTAPLVLVCAVQSAYGRLSGFRIPAYTLCMSAHKHPRRYWSHSATVQDWNGLEKPDIMTSTPGKRVFGIRIKTARSCTLQ